MLRFWFDRGADGIRIDSAALLTKDPTLPDVGPDETARRRATRTSDRDDVHEIYRSWRALADAYGEPGADRRGLAAGRGTRLARYVSPGEMHTVFNFPYLGCAWDAARLREVIDATLAAARPGRRARHLGAVQPRRGPGSCPGTAGPTPRSASGPARSQPARRPGARHPQSPRRGAADHGPARRRCTSTRVRSWACGRSRTSPTELAPGPDLAPHRRRRPGPGRLPRAAALGGRRAAVRLLPARRRRAALAPAARTAGAT